MVEVLREIRTRNWFSALTNAGSLPAITARPRATALRRRAVARSLASTCDESGLRALEGPFGASAIRDQPGDRPREDADYLALISCPALLTDLSFSTVP